MTHLSYLNEMPPPFRKLFFLGSWEGKRILPGKSSGIERLP